MGNAKIEVFNQEKTHALVKMSGSFDPATVAETAKTYEDLLRAGTKRVLIDLTGSTSDLHALMSSRQELVAGLSHFERVSVLVADSGVAFGVKAVASHDSDSRVKFTYKPEDALAWVRG